MDNFVGALEMKNAMNTEDEHDLTLSLGCGTSTPIGTSPITLPPNPITSPQTNISFIELPTSSSYPSFLVSSSTQQHINPLFLGSSSNTNPNPLLLASSSNHNPSPNHLLLPSSSNHNIPVNVDVNAPPPGLTTRRSRRASSQRRAQGKSETVPAPFPWATERRATIHNRKYLMEKNIDTITGMVHCKRCEQEYKMAFDLEEKVSELRKFIRKERVSMHDRAPAAWANPVLPKCVHCGKENSVKPILGVDTKKREINWLFLLLGQMIGCCTLDHLKYFCKHTNNHRTGAKDRLLYLAYMTLSKQLVPEWFD